MNALQTLRSALQKLADRDGDRARERNDVGFAGIHTNLGHSLVAAPDWTFNQAKAALAVVSYYKNTQLQGWEFPTLQQIGAEVAKEQVARAERVLEASKNLVEYGLCWGQPKTVKTSRGLSEVISAPVTEAFWAAWRSNKETVKAAGFSVGQHNGQWQVSKWKTLEAAKPVVKVERVVTPLRDQSILRPWQLTAAASLVASLRAYKFAVDLSDTGTGKTFTSLGTFRELNLPGPILVHCRKPARVQWQKAAAIVGVQIIVVTYELVRRGTTPYGKWIGAKEDEFQWDESVVCGIIFDEVHWASGHKTQNGDLVIAARRQQIPSIGLSATVAESPLKLRAVGYALGLHGLKGYWDWTRKYGAKPGYFGGFEWDQDNPTNKTHMTRLHSEILPEKGVRIRKADLGDKFPKTQIIPDLVDFGDKIAKVYEEMEKELDALAGKESADRQLDEELAAAAYKEIQSGVKNGPAAKRWEDRQKGSAILIRLRARQKVELLKVPVLLDIIKDAIEAGQRVAVFVNFNDTLDILVKEFADLNPAVVRGVSGAAQERARQEGVERFQADQTPLCLANTAAGGESINLQGKNRLALISPNDSARIMHQIFGRVNRDGGEFSVQKILLAAGSVEEKIYANFNSKLANLAALNDGIPTLTDGDLSLK